MNWFRVEIQQVTEMEAIPEQFSHWLSEILFQFSPLATCYEPQLKYIPDNIQGPLKQISQRKLCDPCWIWISVAGVKPKDTLIKYGRSAFSHIGKHWQTRPFRWSAHSLFITYHHKLHMNNLVPVFLFDQWTNLSDIIRGQKNTQAYCRWFEFRFHPSHQICHMWHFGYIPFIKLHLGFL